MEVSDTYRHKGLRRNLVKLLKARGISDEKVLQAIENIPRHLFFEKVFLEYAYQDIAFKIGAGQTISQPYTVAYQTTLLQLQKGDKVLEIGTGSGYQCCVLMELGAKVFSIERQRLLFDKASQFLPRLGFLPKLFYGDGYKGLPTYAPYDKILVTAGAPFIPNELIQQLKPGGILVIPVGEGPEQIMVRVIRRSDGSYEKQELDKCSFVPMLENRSV